MKTSHKGTDLPHRERQYMRKAAKLEWLSIGYAAFTITLVALIVGNSQAMRTAWVEDMLSVLPQLAFLVSLQFTRLRRRATHPYGYHRSMGAGHLVAGVALLAVGGMLAYESISALIKAEHPTIGTMNMFGHTIWQGWLMMAVMAVIAAPAVILGKLKVKVAKPLDNKLLYADADMAKADWQTNAASIVGVAGIAIGLWWLDSVAATVIAAGILKDGWTNTRVAVVDLLDRRSTLYDGTDPHPLQTQVEERLQGQDWVREVAVRMRELGQVLHVEAFVVPHSSAVTTAQLEHARKACEEIDWQIYDMVMVPVEEIPDYFDEGK